MMVHPVNGFFLPEEELFQSADGRGPEGGHGPVHLAGRSFLLHLGSYLQHTTAQSLFVVQN